MASFGGRGSEKRLVAEQECPQCQQKGKVYYVGSTVVHGNPYSPAADTEVDHHYKCENCQHEWDEYT